MKPLVYIEASVVSYLTARPSKDARQRTMQEVTKQWWTEQLTHVQGCFSPFVTEEIEIGDPTAAKERMNALQGLISLPSNEEILLLAEYLLRGGGLPQKARLDALHIACAAHHRVDVLLTWNFKHIANPTQMPVSRGLCSAKGYQMPELVSPLEMLGSQS
jgi:predicted nucleic acid-binding protein